VLEQAADLLQDQPQIAQPLTEIYHAC
jgi:hypothetical protein